MALHTIEHVPLKVCDRVVGMGPPVITSEHKAERTIGLYARLSF
jgi:hypothetical protein